MALSKDLEEELTCPIDLEYFVEPMQLKCLHLLCKKDVNHMMDEDKLIQCPVCNRVSEKRDIKKDFRAKRLIELLQCDKDKHKEQQVCECDQELAICLCRECNMYFGKQCQRVHKKMTATKEHHLDPITNIIADSKERIQNYVLEIKSKASEYGQKKDKLIKTKDITINSPLYTKIQESEDAIINETKRVHDELRKHLQIELDKRTTNMVENLSNIDSKLDLLNRKMQILREILDNNDNKTLLNTEFINEIVDPTLTTQDKTAEEIIAPFTPEKPKIALSARDQILKELRQLKLVIDKTQDQSSKISPVESSGAVPKRRINIPKSQTARIRADNLSTSIISTRGQKTDITTQGQDMPQKDFTNLLTKQLHSNVVYRFKECPESISLIMNEIWVVLETGNIEILQEKSNTSIRKVNSFSIHHKLHISGNKEKMQLYARKILGTDDKTIIAACCGEQFDDSTDEEVDIAVPKPQTPGLVTINRHGLVQHVIAGGAYQDVSHANGCVYGLLAYSVITVHTKKNQDWCKVKSISLEKTADGLRVVNNSIILFTSYPASVSLYDLESNTQRELASPGDRVDEASDSNVSCADNGGNVLICDSDNDRLQVLLVDNTWRTLNVAETLKQPWDAAVSNDGRLYVISGYENTLSILS